MEKYYFSGTTLGFYPESLKDLYVAAGTWPEDAVEISNTAYENNKVCEQGRELVSRNGKPARVKKKTDAEENAAINLKNIETALTSASKRVQPYQFAVDLDEATEDDKVKLTEYKKYILDLHRLKSSDLTKKIKMPSAPEEA